MSESSLLSLPAVINYLAALHGFILASIIGRKRHNPFDANSILAILLGLSAVSLAGATLYNGGEYRIWPHLLLLFDPFVLLIPPLIYQYVLARLHGPLQWHPRLMIHLIPFAYNLVAWFPFYRMNAREKVAYYVLHLQHPSPFSWVILPRILMSTFYILLSIIVLVRYTRSLSKVPGETQKKNISWLWHFLLGVLFVWASITFIHGHIPTQVSEEAFNHLSNLLSSVFIFILGYRVLLHPEILNREMSVAEAAKYQKTGIQESDIDRIWHDLCAWMEQGKPFLDGALGLKEISEQIAIPQHQLSQVINQKSGTNLYAFLNGHRVRHAQELLKNKPTHKLLTLAFSSGFQSLSTFNRVFKDITGQSPSEYRKGLSSPKQS